MTIPIALFSGVFLGWCLRVAAERANRRVETTKAAGYTRTEVIPLDDYRVDPSRWTVN